MKQFIGAFLGMILGGVVLGSLATGAVGLVALGGVAAWVVMAQDLDVAVPASVSTAGTSTSTRSSAPSAPSAVPGALQIHTFAAVVIQVDGAPLTIDQRTGNYEIELSPGVHVVQVFNAWTKEVAREEHTIRAGKRLMLEYHAKQKVFSKVGEVGYAAAAPAPAPPPVVVVAAAPEPVVVQAVASTPQVAAVVAVAEPDPEPRNVLRMLGGLQLGGGGETTSRSKSSASSTRYGEVNTHAPGVSETHGYHDTVSAEAETTKRRRFGL
ncbi:MAG: hypothetical protein R3F61_04245 [Myxococcota bacterium]